MNFERKSNENYIPSKSENRRFDEVKLCAVETLCTTVSKLELIIN